MGGRVKLPLIQSTDRTLMLLETQWSQMLNPVLALPLNQGLVLKSVSLANGTTVLNHLLGRMLQGWFIVDINGPALVYRSQPKNNLTLTLTSNASVTADIFVF